MRIFRMMMYKCLWQTHDQLCLFLLQQIPYFYLAKLLISYISNWNKSNLLHQTYCVDGRYIRQACYISVFTFWNCFLIPHFLPDKGWDCDITPLIVMARIVEVRVKLLHYSATRLKWFIYWIPWSVLPVLSKFIKLSWSEISK